MKINNMREIKFRAWDGEIMWSMTELLLEALSDTNESYLHCILRGDEIFQDWILMQYTGLKDKNSKEIYEGDIVEWKYLKTWHKNEVRWVGGGFVITTSGFKDDLNEPQDLSLVSILNCEIIGNIYENPELLIPNTQ